MKRFAFAIGLLLLSGAAKAVEPRFSVAVGGVGIDASKDQQLSSMTVQYTLDLEATVELGGFFAGAVWLPDLSGEGSVPRQWFLGAKAGFAMPHWLVAPYLACGAGYLKQRPVFVFDEGSNGEGSGFAFMPEAGVVIGRDPRFGRLWMFAFALLPTFSAKAFFNVPGETTLNSWGAGLRLGL
jgi:hypothetical protein